MVRVGPQCIPHAPSRTADAPLNTLSSFDHVTHTHSHVVAQHIHQQHLHAARMDCVAWPLVGAVSRAAETAVLLPARPITHSAHSESSLNLVTHNDEHAWHSHTRGQGDEYVGCHSMRRFRRAFQYKSLQVNRILKPEGTSIGVWCARVGYTHLRFQPPQGPAVIITL